MELNLYRKHRPKTLKSLAGNPEIVKVLTGFLSKKKLPPAILLSGASGCGKTTVARILKRELSINDADYQELNAASSRGIDDIRAIGSRMGYSAMSGEDGKRMYVIDEAHQLTKPAQESALKMLEDTPSHVHFVLCTTAPERLLPTIRTRCTQLQVKPLVGKTMEKLIARILEKEKSKLSEEVVDHIVKHAGGSARAALVHLEAVLQCDDDESQLEASIPQSAETKAFELARLLITTPGKIQWASVKKVLEGLKDEEPEQLRWMILGYASSVLLGGGKLAPKAYLAINAFRDNYYDTKRAGLIASCWEMVTQGKG